MPGRAGDHQGAAVPKWKLLLMEQRRARSSQQLMLAAATGRDAGRDVVDGGAPDGLEPPRPAGVCQSTGSGASNPFLDSRGDIVAVVADMGVRVLQFRRCGDDEELQYGPGIVSRLKSRYLRQTSAGRPAVLRRVASLEDLLERDSADQTTSAHSPLLRDDGWNLVKRTKSTSDICSSDCESGPPSSVYSSGKTSSVSPPPVSVRASATRDQPPPNTVVNAKRVFESAPYNPQSCKALKQCGAGTAPFCRTAGTSPVRPTARPPAPPDTRGRVPSIPASRTSSAPATNQKSRGASPPTSSSSLSDRLSDSSDIPALVSASKHDLHSFSHRITSSKFNDAYRGLFLSRQSGADAEADKFSSNLDCGIATGDHIDANSAPESLVGGKRVCDSVAVSAGGSLSCSSRVGRSDSAVLARRQLELDAGSSGDNSAAVKRTAGRGDPSLCQTAGPDRVADDQRAVCRKPCADNMQNSVLNATKPQRLANAVGSGKPNVTIVAGSDVLQDSVNGAVIYTSNRTQPAPFQSVVLRPVSSNTGGATTATNKVHRVSLHAKAAPTSGAADSITRKQSPPTGTLAPNHTAQNVIRKQSPPTADSTDSVQRKQSPPTGTLATAQNVIRKQSPPTADSTGSVQRKQSPPTGTLATHHTAQNVIRKQSPPTADSTGSVQRKQSPPTGTLATHHTAQNVIRKQSPPTADSMDNLVKKRAASGPARRAARQHQDGALTFNFTRRAVVPDYVEDDGLILRRSRCPQRGESGYAFLPGFDRASIDQQADSVLTSRPPSPCDVTFINADVIINGRSNLRRIGLNTPKTVSFSGHVPVVHEYPSSSCTAEYNGGTAPQSTAGGDVAVRAAVQV